MGHAGLHAHFGKTEVGPFDSFLMTGEELGVKLSDDEYVFWRNLFQRYEKHWGADDAGMEILEIEYPIEIELIPGVKLLMTMDMIVKKHGRLWVWDHKFYKKRTSQDSLMLDPQMSAYIWALRKEGKYKVSGAIYDVIIKKEPRKPDVLKSGKLSKAKDLVTDYDTYMKAIMENQLDPKEYWDYLDMLKAREEDSSFFQRIIVARSPIENTNFQKDLTYKVQSLIGCGRDMDRYFPNEADHCSYCEYLPLCKARMEGADMSCILPMYKEKLEGQR